MTFEPKPSYSYEEIINCGKGNLFGPGNALLPLPPMLMFDRITNVSASGGTHDKGFIEAEFDINPDLWFFKCHFENDPVMPGCLGLDAVWQLLGFYLGWTGAQGSGRAIGIGELKLSDMILPEAKLVKYRVDVTRLINRRLVLGVGDAVITCDDKVVCEVKDLKVGLFQSSK